MASTPIYNWPTPDNTDLVKNGALAIRTLGDAIDTTMDTMIPETIFAAKGDLLGASANDTPAVLTVGADGETLVADSSTSTGLRYQATKSTQQAILNGGMDIWQRGTSFTYNNQSAYSADRWNIYSANTAATVTRQAGTGEFQYVMRLARNNTTSNTGVIQCNQSVTIDEATQFAGKTVTLSFYAKAGANFSAASSAISVAFYSGTGSTDVNRSNSAYTGDTTVLSTTQVITSTLTRYSFTFTLGSTVTQFASFFGFTPVGTAGANDWFEITGIQLEVGSVATTFRRAGGTIQGELAACQRYYYRVGGTGAYEYFAFGVGYSTTNGVYLLPYKSTLRTNPSAVEYASLEIVDPGSGSIAITSVTIDNTGTNQISINAQVASGLISKRPYFVRAAGTTAGYLGFSAEL
jgi:hypothetical protein